MMDLLTLIYFFISSILVATLPGPAMALVIQGAIDNGVRKGLSISLGILLADSVLLLFVCLGLGELLASSPTIYFWMSIITSAYLLYLGIKSLYAIRHIRSNSFDDVQELTWKNGFLITLVNPKTLVFLLAYFPQFIINNSTISELQQLMILSVLFLISVAMVMFTYAFLANSVRYYLLKVKVRIFMNLLFGFLLIGIGLHNIWSVV